MDRKDGVVEDRHYNCGYHGSNLEMKIDTCSFWSGTAPVKAVKQQLHSFVVYLPAFVLNAPCLLLRQKTITVSILFIRSSMKSNSITTKVSELEASFVAPLIFRFHLGKISVANSYVSCLLTLGVGVRLSPLSPFTILNDFSSIFFYSDNVANGGTGSSGGVP